MSGLNRKSLALAICRHIPPCASSEEHEAERAASPSLTPRPERMIDRSVLGVPLVIHPDCCKAKSYGVRCELREGHEGPHQDFSVSGHVRHEWSSAYQARHDAAAPSVQESREESPPASEPTKPVKKIFPWKVDVPQSAVVEISAGKCRVYADEDNQHWMDDGSGAVPLVILLAERVEIVDDAATDLAAAESVQESATPPDFLKLLDDYRDKVFAFGIDVGKNPLRSYATKEEALADRPEQPALDAKKVLLAAVASLTSRNEQLARENKRIREMFELERDAVVMHIEYAESLRSQVATMERDVRVVAGFVAGYWPGLEDGISDWGDESLLQSDPRLVAAQRLLDSLSSPKQDDNDV